MKAVIVEIKDGYAAVLSDEGCILKVKNNNYEIGQEITMDQKKVLITKKLAVMAASAAMFVTLCGVGTWAYASPYSYVSLDVNPSIEYTINRFDRVIDINAVNDDGSEILDQVKVEELENKSIQDALDQTIEQIADEGYFEGEAEGGIVIATSGKDPEKAAELAEELQQTAAQTVSEHGDKIQIEIISVGLERVEEAHALGVTPGKLNLIEKLQASAADPDSIKIEDWLNKPVKDIMKATKENKNIQKENSNESIIENEINTDSSEDLAEDNIKDIVEEDKNIDKDEKNAEKNIEKQNKADEREKEKAEKEAKKQKEQAEKDAKKQQDQSDKDSKKQQNEADKDIKKQQDQADQDAKKQQDQSEKDVKNNGKNDKSVKDQADQGSDNRNNQSDKEQNDSEKDDSQSNNRNNNSQNTDNGKNNNSKGKNNG